MAAECPRCLGPLADDGLCPAGERARAERAAQGHPPTVTDPVAIASIATIVVGAFREPAA